MNESEAGLVAEALSGEGGPEPRCHLQPSHALPRFVAYGLSGIKPGLGITDVATNPPPARLRYVSPVPARAGSCGARRAI
jgi:hypothetical protein